MKRTTTEEDPLGWGRPGTIEVGRWTFDVVSDGPQDGEVALLLHGFPQGIASWSMVGPTVAAAGLRVVAPAMRGYSPGARPVGVEHYRVEELVGDVVGMIDALGAESVHLVGHDWGALVSWFVAQRHRERVRTLTAVSVPHPAAFGAALVGDPEQREASRYTHLFRSDRAERVMLEDDARRLRAWFPPAVPTSHVESYVREAFVDGAFTAQLGYYRAMTRSFADLPPVDVPTTYVWGAGDLALRRSGAEACGDHVTGDYRFVELAGVGHWVPEVAPEVLSTEILRRAGRSRKTPRS